MICLAPALPKTPGSLGFGLLSLPLFLLKKPNMLLLLPLSVLENVIAPASSGAGELWSARPDQLFVPSNTICAPPPLLILRVAGVGLCGGSGRLKDFEAEAGLGELGALGIDAFSSSRVGKPSSFCDRTGDMSARSGGDPSGEAGDDRVCERVGGCDMTSSTCSSGTVPATAAAALMS